MSGYRGLADRVKRIKSQPQAGEQRNRAQVEALDRRIRKAINSYQQVESAFRKDVQEQQRRQYLIVRPEATESEIREATESNGDVQIFQQALLQSDRRGQAQSTLSNVKQRHDAIQQIERTMMELQQLFQDLDQIVVMQEPLVQNIEQRTEETNTQLEHANVDLGHGVQSARAARKKKFICLGIISESRSIVAWEGRVLTCCSCDYPRDYCDCPDYRRDAGLVQEELEGRADSVSLVVAVLHFWMPCCIAYLSEGVTEGSYICSCAWPHRARLANTKRLLTGCFQLVA